MLPGVRITSFPQGVTLDNVDAFVANADHVVDVVDVYAYREKIAIHRAARQHRIACTVCFSVGFGGVVTTFPYDQDSPSYESITGTSFDVDSRENTRRLIRWMSRVIPSPIEDRILAALRGEGPIPFVVTGVEIGAAIAAAATVEHLLYRRGVYAPKVIAFDPFGGAAARSAVVDLGASA